MKRYAAEYRVEMPGFTPDAIDALCAYNWPGNIRELENEVQRLVIQAESGHWIESTDLSPRLRKIEGTVTRIAPNRSENVPPMPMHSGPLNTLLLFAPLPEIAIGLPSIVAVTSGARLKQPTLVS